MNDIVFEIEIETAFELPLMDPRDRRRYTNLRYLAALSSLIVARSMIDPSQQVSADFLFVVRE